MYLCIFWLLLLSIYKIFFLLNCVIYACWGIPWQNFLESPLHTWGMERLCYLSKFVSYTIPFASYVRKWGRLKIQRHALRIFDDMTKGCQARWVHIHGLYDLFRATITNLIPSSLAKDTAFRHAKASATSTVCGGGILSDNTPTTLPDSSRITTPIPAVWELWNMALSKFTLRVGLRGGIQWISCGSEIEVAGRSWADWNSWSPSSMSWYTIDRGKWVVFVLAALQLYQML